MIRALLLSIVLLAGCAEDKNTDPEGASALLKRLQTEDYRSWTRPPGWESRKKAASPHSDEVEIYVSSAVVDVLTRKVAAKTWPVGSIVVKDGFKAGRHDLTAVMEKREDGWFYAEFGSDGTPLFSGQPSVCVQCHETGADFIRAFGFPP